MAIAYQSEILQNRLKKRYAHLRKWARRCGNGAFRLYDRDIPEIPLVLDYYEGFLESRPGAEMVRAVSGAVYKKPDLELNEPDPVDTSVWLDAMKQAIETSLDIAPEHIYFKERRRVLQRQEQYQKDDAVQAWMEVKEASLRYRVNLSDYLDTGLFFDRRLLRAYIKAEADGKRVLNLFSYTGAFSLSAAAGGAAAVDSVDLSNTYLKWAELNFARNQDRFPHKTHAKFIRADVSRFLNESLDAGRLWNMIILDPPSFSNSKKMSGVLDIKRDHPGLLRKCLKLLRPGGKLFFSVNKHGFRLDDSVLHLEGVSVKDISRRLVDEDFCGKRMPLSFEFTRAG
jgi:23S rRNA G2069 N7-methylase RlmK/C1962 C5-methylase RlmI